jgi:hypothetical protein
MKQLLYAVFTVLTPILAVAQTDNLPPILCGNEVFEHILHNHHPELHDNFEATYAQLLAQSRRPAGAQERNPLTINVVVHVVWKDAVENISDALIREQFEVLNRDFNRLNPDTVNLRDVFKSAAGSADIRFNLAEVRRVQTTRDFQVNLLGTNLLADLKSSDKGGSTAADPTRFLNIWVCRIRPISLIGIPLGQILGFAFPPANLPNWPANASAPTPGEDGVTLDFRTIGINNPNPGGGGALVVRGRTAVHEIGHYLGLRHIWGDGGALGSANRCDQSDGIDDTPFANSQTQFNCDKTRNTCPNVEGFYKTDVPDMIENYMDYAAETCMNTFTKGQIAIMRSTLQGPRRGLIGLSTSTKNIDQLTAWKVWPNPAYDRIVVEAEAIEGQTQVQLLAADGRLIQNNNLPTARRIELPVAGLPTGMYFVRLHTTRGVSVQKVYVSEQF